MAYIRKLPSGKWQATVRLPSGKKITTTSALKSAVKVWAAEREADAGRGDVRDPRAGQVRVAEWHARVSAAQTVQRNTQAKNTSLWRTHCEPMWGKWPMGSITRLDAQGWVGKLMLTHRAWDKGRPVSGQESPVLGAETIHGVVRVMSALFRAALAEHPPLVASNPFSALDLPPIEPVPVQFLEHEEAEALYAAMPSLKWRTLAELGTEVGLRPGELFGLHGQRVDWLRAKITVVDVMTRYGLRRWPKSKKSHRSVPVRPEILEGMSTLLSGHDWRGDCLCPLVSDTPAERSRKAAQGYCPGLLFTAPEGGPVLDGTFRRSVWVPAIQVARLCGSVPLDEAEPGKPLCGPGGCADPGHMIRRFPPRIMRHTAASWLVQDGVPLYDVQALLGHESFATTQRYAHLMPDAHGRILESWARRSGAPGASVAHGPSGGPLPHSGTGR